MGSENAPAPRDLAYRIGVNLTYNGEFVLGYLADHTTGVIPLRGDDVIFEFEGRTCFAEVNKRSLDFTGDAMIIVLELSTPLPVDV